MVTPGGSPEAIETGMPGWACGIVHVVPGGGPAEINIVQNDEFMKSEGGKLGEKPETKR